MNYINSIDLPIQNALTTDIVIDQFQNLDISTTYFIDLFENISSNTVNKCFINNTFCEDYCDLLTSIFDDNDLFTDNNYE